MLHTPRPPDFNVEGKAAKQNKKNAVANFASTLKLGGRGAIKKNGSNRSVYVTRSPVCSQWLSSFSSSPSQREREREREKKTITNSTYRRADRRDKSKENEQRAKSNAKNT